jgi:Fe-S-cluster-containing dehydrogenase component
MSEDHQNDDEREAVVEGVGKAQASRRRFLQVLGAATATAATSQADAAPWEDFFQQHYKRLTDEDKRQIFARLEAEVQDKYGVAVRISDPKPIDGVEFAYALNLQACVGCRRCEYACAQENNTSRSPEMHYIRVLQMDKGSLDVERSNTTYEGAVPTAEHYYQPVQCHQCRDAPCVRACPVNATWAEPDGIVVVDYNWCIGCRYCEAACPYFARRFNYEEPTVRPSEINPDQGYLSNRLRPRGVMEKCTYCLHRTRKGLMPACLEACPTGSRKFGNLLDPNSEVRQVIETKRVYILHEDAGTNPRFYYYFG